MDFSRRRFLAGSAALTAPLALAACGRADRPAGRSCGMAFEVEKGLVYFVLDTMGSEDPQGDPCVEIMRIAGSLRSSLPPATN